LRAVVHAPALLLADEPTGIVSSTLGTGTTVSGYDPSINAQFYSDHNSQSHTNRQLYGVSVYKLNTNLLNVSYEQSFPTESYLEVDWDTAGPIPTARTTA
jgi:hypothetical protein